MQAKDVRQAYTHAQLAECYSVLLDDEAALRARVEALEAMLRRWMRAQGWAASERLMRDTVGVLGDETT